MQAYVASDDPEIRAIVRAGYGDLVAYVRRVSDADWPHVWHFFATGMMLNVLASMQVNEDPGSVDDRPARGLRQGHLVLFFYHWRK